MRSLLKLALALGLAVGAVAAPVDSTSDGSSATNTTSDDDDSYSHCKVVTFTVNGSAQNKNLTGSVPVDTIEALREFFAAAPLFNVSGPQNLVGTYCTPTTWNKNNGKLEVLFQSITADRHSWSALGGVGSDFPAFQPQNYSWTRYANARGYPTLTIDRLGNGASDHPDPLLVVQSSYEMALYNDLATQLRKGAPQLGGWAPSFLIYVGNSYGSQLGAGIAGAYPQAYDEFLLTGFSTAVDADFLGVAQVLPVPAAIQNPARFGTLSAGYLAPSSEIGKTGSFFGSPVQVSFDPAVAHQFFVRQDVVSLGQFVSVYAGVFDGKGFTGRVFTLDGEQDQAFCGPGNPDLGPADCGTLPQETGSLFPDADYNWRTVNRTGHAVQFHLSAQLFFKTAHDFLDGEEFRGGPPL